jgi:hypothetical protein
MLRRDQQPAVSSQHQALIISVWLLALIFHYTAE